MLSGFHILNPVVFILVVLLPFQIQQCTGSPSSQHKELYCLFLLFCERSAKRDMWHILLHNNRIWPRKTWLMPCCIWRCCVTMVRFEFIKVCMGIQQFCWKSQFCLYFVNTIYLPCCCIVFFCCLPASPANLHVMWFRQVIVLWVLTAKRKTRLHTNFRSACRSKRINPLKISLPTQFLRRIKKMLKVHVSSPHIVSLGNLWTVCLS